MGSYTFRWEQPADEVFVTGPFDNWSHSVKLDKKDTGHEKTVSVSDISHSIPYKFFVDGQWQYDPSKRQEPDPEGNVNNVLYPEELDPPNSMASQTISSVAPGVSTTAMAGAQPLERRSEKEPSTSAASHTMSTVAPGASTTEMAGAQPLEQKSDNDGVPGAFPITPGLESSHEDGSNKGILAGAAAAGAGVAAAVGGTLASFMGGSSNKEQEGDQTMSVNPIPASEGVGNPIHLAPGEKVPDPSTINNNTLTSTVRDDPSLQSSSRDADQTFGVAPIPASGGMGNPVHLQPGEKVPDPTTITGNTLTSNVKLDKESYEKSDTGAPQIPPTDSSSPPTVFGLGEPTPSMIPESSMGMGKDAPAPLEGAALSSVGANSTTNQLAGRQPLEPRGVPEVVAESQKEAHVAPEASANPTAVEEKKEMENELKGKVPEEQAGSENKTGIYAAVAGGVAAAGAAVAGAAVVAREKTHQATGTDPVSVLPTSVQQSIDSMNKQADASSAVPREVKESQKEAHADPEASANAAAVQEKSQAEQELLKKVPESQASGEPAPTATAATTAVAPTTSASGAPQLGDPVGGGLAPINMEDKPATSSALNAPAAAPAQTPASKAVAATEKSPQDSRDVSPMSKPIAGGLVAGAQPSVTTGTSSGAAPSTSTPVGTPRKDAPQTPTSNKRHSFAGRFKGTPESQNTTGTEGKKKKGLLKRIIDKLKS